MLRCHNPEPFAFNAKSMKAAVRFGAVSVMSKTVRLFFVQNIGSVRFGYLFYMSRFDAVSVFIPGFALMHTKLSNIPRA